MDMSGKDVLRKSRESRRVSEFETYVDQAMSNTKMVRALWWVRTAQFDYTMGLIIVLNAIFIGAQADRKAPNPMAETSRIFVASEDIFSCVFVLELALKIIVHRFGFIFSEDRWWNLFDLFVVLAGVCDR